MARIRSINQDTENMDAVYRGMHSLVGSILNGNSQYKMQKIERTVHWARKMAAETGYELCRE